MIEALIDTNVVLDYAEKREEFFEVAEKVFVQMLRGAFVGFVSASAVTDVYYFLGRRYKDPEIVMSILKTLLGAIDVLAVDRGTIEAALASGCPTSRMPSKPSQRTIAASTSLSHGTKKVL